MQDKKSGSLFKFNRADFEKNLDMTLISLFLLVIATFLNGFTALLQSAVCVLVSVVSEYLAFRLVLKENHLGNLGAFCTGLMISLFLPACAPLWLGAFASAFAVIAVSLPFGGTRNAPFAPALCAVCFAQLCFPSQMFTYGAQNGFSSLLFAANPNFVSGESLLSMLSSGKMLGLNLFSVLKLLCGTLPGALGATSMLSLTGVLVYLSIRRKSAVFVPLFGYFFFCAFSLIFLRGAGGAFQGMVLRLCAGTFVLACLLFTCDSSAKDESILSLVLYGLCVAAIYTLLLKTSKIEDPACFAILLTQAVLMIFKNKTENAKEPSKKKASTPKPKRRRGGADA